MVVLASLGLLSLIGFAAQSRWPDLGLPLGGLGAPPSATAAYVAAFVPADYALAGADFFNERYSPGRLGKPLEEIDRTYDYDFGGLQRTFARLEGVRRTEALRGIFHKITAGAKTGQERALAVLAFLQQASYHGYIQPVHENRQGVTDPLVLLELGEMRCGAVSRLAVDLFASVGWQARIVQAAGHQSAEIYYDRDWHLFEADLAGGGLAVMINGRIPSVAELAKTPYLIDQIPAYFESRVKRSGGEQADGGLRGTARRSGRSPTYPSYFFFCKAAYGDLKDAYYYKTATKQQEEESVLYGWNYYRADQDRWALSDLERKFEPDAPVFAHIEIGDGRAKLSWEPSLDSDNDLLGYRVYVSKRSRGWNYQAFSGAEEVRKYCSAGWKPEMYDALYREPPSEVALITTKEEVAEIELPQGETRYLTVMPFDRHGESVGRKLYNMSEELTLTNG